MKDIIISADTEIITKEKLLKGDAYESEDGQKEICQI